MLPSVWAEVQVRIVRGLLPLYMGPLFLVYFRSERMSIAADLAQLMAVLSEYTINQGLFEHLLFKKTSVSTEYAASTFCVQACLTPDCMHAAHSTGFTRPSTRLASSCHEAAGNCFPSGGSGFQLDCRLVPFSHAHPAPPSATPA